MVKQLLCGASLLAIASFSNAGIVTQEFTIPLQKTNLTNTITYDLFDSKGGLRTLESVEISLLSIVRGESVVENQGPSSTSVTANLAAKISLRDLVGNIILTTAPSASKTKVLAGFDGKLDFAGPSGTQFLDLESSVSASTTFLDPGELLSYIGTTSSTIDFKAVALSYLCGSGNMTAGFSTFAGGDFSIVYKYSELPIKVSAPAQFGLLGFGLIALVAWRRSRLK